MNTPIHTALRNHTVLSWWRDTGIAFRFQARRDYAARLGCCESELGDIDTMFPQDSDVIDWLAVTYPNVIDGWVSDQL